MTKNMFIKNLNGLRFVLILSVLLLGVGKMWATGSNGYYYYYYAKVTAKTATACTGQGKVYVSTAAASVDNATSETSSATGQDPNNYGESTSAPSEAGQVAFYLYAKPASGYKFDGWSTSSTRPDVFESTNPVWETTFGASTTQGSNTTTNPGGTQNSGTTKSGSNKTQYYSTSTAEHTVYAYFSEMVSEFAVSFAQPTNGSIKVGSVTPSSWPYQVNTTTGELATTLTATPNSGYSFWGWYTLNNDGSKNYLSYDATYNATFNDAATVYAEFYSSSLALFQVAGVNFYDLNQANAKAVANGGGTIIVTKDGTVPAGDYTINSGVTLLVPLNADNQVNTTPSTVTSGTPSRKVYRTLTLANGANITLKGSICVNAIMCLTMGYNGSAMNGYGLINMKAGSTITMKSGSNFYVWGFVIGDGSIVAESESTIHETFQFKHRGGNALTSIASTNSSKKVFPINQYYIQSIEAPITFKKGAKETVYTGVHNTSTPVSIDFIGTSGLFNLTGTNAYLIKKYDVSKDRQNYTLYGDATIGSIKFGMSGFYKESKDFVLPITNNMTLNVESGTTTIQYETAILPDVEVNIASAAKISTSANCYVYDSLNWKGAYAYANDYSTSPEKAQIAPVVYRHGGLQYNRKNYKLRDAKVNVNGTFEGKIYTTEGGANIMSSLGTGIVKLTTALSSTTTYQAGQDGTTGKFDAYTVDPAQLHNSAQWYSGSHAGEGKACEYLATAGAAANTTITYANGHWGWMEIWQDEEEATVLAASNTRTKVNNAAAKDDMKPAAPEGYEIVWETTVDDTNQEVIHSAVAIRNTFTVTWKDQSTTIKSETWNRNEIPSFEYVKEPTAQYYYILTGWNDGKKTYAKDALPAVTEDVTYTAIYTHQLQTYTVRFLNDDGSELQSSVQSYGSTPTYTGDTPGSTLEDGNIRAFAGWSPEIESYLVAADIDYVATYEIVASLLVNDRQTITVNGSVNTTTVQVQGSLTIAEGKKLQTAKLVLEASPDHTGEIKGDLDADEAYYDYSLGSSESGIWYDIAVPWDVDATTGIYIDGEQKRLNRDFYLIYYNGTLRASQNGHTDACWQFVNQESSPDRFMHPGRLYMIYLPTAGVEKLRFERYASGLLTTPELQVYRHDASSVVNAGWNGIANPASYRAFMNAGAKTLTPDDYSTQVPHFGQKYIPSDDNYRVFNMSTTPLEAAQPIFVQVAEDRTVVLNPVSYPASSVPERRAKVKNAYYEVQIAGENESFSDRLYLLVMANKEEIYTIGLDLAKAGVSAKVAQMWVNRYGSKLCVNTTAPKGTSATYPLTIRIPVDGNYQINSATEMQEGQQMYVTLNGRAVWNLAYGPYEVSLTKGTHTEYGLKLVQSPAVTTGVENGELTNGANGVHKVLIDNQIYIIREGAVYTMNGQIVK